MTSQQLQTLWNAYDGILTLVGLVAVVAVATVTFALARHRGRTQQWLAAAANLATLALSAEGMWMVATARLGLPAPFAVGVFFVAEAMLVSEAMLAGRHYRRTGHPGPHGVAVWAIAAVAGVIVATNATSLTEVLLRLALPLAVAGLWWASITAEDVATRRAGRWRWTPRRALIQLGALIAEDGDIEQINREHIIRAMTQLARKVHHDTRPDRVIAVRRLRKLERLAALHADDTMLGEVQRRVRRAARVTELTHPDHRTAAAGTRPDTNGDTTADTMPDIRPDILPGATPDTTSDICPGAAPDNAAAADTGIGADTNDTGAAPTARDGRARRGATTQAAIAELAAAHPDLSRRDIARRLGVDERTVRRHLTAIQAAEVNGHTPTAS